jgi:hypothetical protein
MADISALASALLSGASPKPNIGLFAKALLDDQPRDPSGRFAENESRMMRAKNMGFHISMPLYHGTNAEFDAFNPTIASSKTNNPAAQQAIFAAADPETAAEFAGKASPTSSPKVMKLLHRAVKPASLALDGTETNLEIAATLREAFDRGHDAVRMTNYTTPGGKTGKTIFAIKSPSQLRLADAAFDPEKIDSPMLSA